MSVLSIEEQLPEFTNTFFHPSPFFYFHHTVDAPTASLHIEVIGPNLSFTFSHARGLAVLPPSTLTARLENKTVGFLAMLHPSGKRTVLAWAESGHGLGTGGDVLDDKVPFVLSNALWTRRVIKIGRLLGLGMDHPFDGMGRRRVGDKRGTFAGCHVEVKLAVHGIFVLLNAFDITRDFDNVTKEHLRKLRGALWKDGSRPAFEIYFSRKNCHRCAKLVGELEAATGVAIRFFWKHRLRRQVYHSSRKPYPRPGQAPQPPPLIIQRSHVDLTEATPARMVSHPADSFLDGLAYCVGQFEESPVAARAAVLHFARVWLRWMSSPQQLPSPPGERSRPRQSAA